MAPVEQKAITWVECADRNSMAEALAHELANVIDQAVIDRGHATIALAGGSTPVPAYERLKLQSDNLGRTQVVPTDERWVPVTDPLSNAGMLARALGDTWSIARLADVDAADPDATNALNHAREQLALLTVPFDAVLLGMGDDGHFASIFPDDPAITDILSSDDSIMAAHPESQPTARVTLGPKLLFNTRHLLLAITGKTKRAVLARAIDETGAPSELPIRAVLGSGKPIRIFYSP